MAINCQLWGEGETKQKTAKSMSMISLVFLYKLLGVSPATSIIKWLILKKYWLLLKKKKQNISLNMRASLTKVLHKKLGFLKHFSEVAYKKPEVWF